MIGHSIDRPLLQRAIAAPSHSTWLRGTWGWAVKMFACYMLGVLLAFVVVPAFAAAPSQLTVGSIVVNVGTNYTTNFMGQTSNDKSCKIWKNTGSGPGPYLFGFTYPNAQSGCGFGSNQGSDVGSNSSVGSTSFNVSCPSNSTSNGNTVGTVCDCNVNYVASGQTCVAAAACPVGTASSLTLFRGYDPKKLGYATDGIVAASAWDTGSAVIGGRTCLTAFSKLTSCFAYSGAPTKIYCTAEMLSTGVTGTSTQSATPDATSPCPSGTSAGSVNGITGCYPSSNIPPAPTTSTESKTSATVGDVTTVTTTATGSNGGTTTTVTATNNVTGAVTTTTTNNFASTGTGTNGKTETAKFCQDNPLSPLCRQSTISGTCGAVSCDGDAIQCAIAKEQAARNCTMFDTATTFSSLGASYASGDDPDAATMPSHPSQVTTTAIGSLSDATFLSGGSLADQTVSVGSYGSIVIPWTRLNDIIGYMGLVVMAFAYVAAFKIVGIF